jgi:hypothetical protein
VKGLFLNVPVHDGTKSMKLILFSYSVLICVFIIIIIILIIIIITRKSKDYKATE